MRTNAYLSIQLLIFSLVAAAFTTVYITQPVLPVIEDEFGIDARTASLSVSMVILGIALANLPFGRLADQYPIKPIILVGGTVVAGTGLVCAITDNWVLLIAARFIQGLFIPSLTTCIAAYLVQSLPADRLNVVMGAYVSATVASARFVTRARRSLRRVLRLLIDIQLPALLSLRASRFGIYRRDHIHVPCLFDRNRHGTDLWKAQ
jgi:YNFM family putative membrane transporter